jgi:hypothetical protein
MRREERGYDVPDQPEQDRFGRWLTGFAESRGRFRLFMRREIATDEDGAYGVPTAEFRLRLEIGEDDVETILAEIYKFWGSDIFDSWRWRSSVRLQPPLLLYGISNIEKLMDIVLPHFDRYSLSGPKRHEFAIWREGVELIHRVETGDDG